MKEVLVEGHSRRGRPLGRWRDRVKEYMCERGATRGWIKQGGSVWTGRGGGFSAVATPLKDIPGASEVLRVIYK